MSTKHHSISAVSYNSSGWNPDKGEYLNTILSSHGVHIASLQEHMQLKANLYKIKKHFPDYELFSVPAFKDSSRISAGRPSGGISFLYSQALSRYVTRISCPNSLRVQGLKLCLPDINLLFINAYFPTDTRDRDDSEVLQTLQDIKFLLDSCDHSYKVILMGDLNTDFNRNSTFVQWTSQFLNENDLIPLWNRFGWDFTFCQNRNINGVDRLIYSTIDHFCISSELVDFCSEAMPLHMMENTSNHAPIFLKVNCEITLHPVNEPTSSKSPSPKWDKATPQQKQDFLAELTSLVNNIHVPNNICNCRNVHCLEENHKEEIDDYVLNLLEAIEDATARNIPHTSPGKKTHIVPGWNAEVKPFKDEAYFWYQVWCSAAKPQNCELHFMMKKTRNVYHQILRKVKKAEQTIREDKFINNIMNGRTGNILQEIKKMRNTGKSPTNTVDNKSDPPSIANHFQEIYKNIYNTHNSSVNVEKILDDINSKLSDSDLNVVDQITPALIKRLILKLNSGKNDVHYDFKSDALKLAVDIIAQPLSEILKSCLIHGHFTNVLLFCTLIPIVKDATESQQKSSNYRLIAISSLILKIFDYVILELFEPNLKPSTMQFGFQQHSSTTMSTWTITECINFYTNRGGPVYLCLLDLSKAFDNIKLDLLFKKLESKIHPIFLRLIIFSYIYQECIVRWRDSHSAGFKISNGVRQGAVASPSFFNVYMNDLFSELKESNLGCMIESFYFGIIGYADDFALVSPSCESLQKMINITEEYCTRHGITISTNDIIIKSKTKLIAFNAPTFPTNLQLYNKDLPWVEGHMHLGHYLSSDADYIHDLLQKRAQLITKVHSLRQELGAQKPETLMTLVNIYLSAFYGSSLWDLFSVRAKTLFTTWNNTIRSMYDLPFGTHRFILQQLDTSRPLISRLAARFRRFYNQLADSKRPEVLHLIRLQQGDARSTFGRNCRHLGIPLSRPGARDPFRELVHTPEAHDTWKVPMVKELLQCKAGYAEISVLDTWEIDFLIRDICT